MMIMTYYPCTFIGDPLILPCDNVTEEGIVSIEINRHSGELGCYCTLMLKTRRLLVIRDTRFDENNTAENIVVKYFIGNGKQLEISVGTKPSGYINIMQLGHNNAWDYNFTERIRMSTKGK